MRLQSLSVSGTTLVSSPGISHSSSEWGELRGGAVAPSCGLLRRLEFESSLEGWTGGRQWCKKPDIPPQTWVPTGSRICPLGCHHPIHVGGGGRVWRTKLHTGGSAISLAWCPWTSTYTPGACFLFQGCLYLFGLSWGQRRIPGWGSSSETGLWEGPLEVGSPFLLSASISSWGTYKLPKWPFSKYKQCLAGFLDVVHLLQPRGYITATLGC